MKKYKRLNWAIETLLIIVASIILSTSVIDIDRVKNNTILAEYKSDYLILMALFEDPKIRKTISFDDDEVSILKTFYQNKYKKEIENGIVRKSALYNQKSLIYELQEKI